MIVAGETSLLKPIGEVHREIGCLCYALMCFGALDGDDACCGYARRLAVIAKGDGLKPPDPEAGAEMVLFMDKLSRLAAERFPEAVLIQEGALN